MDMNRMTQKTQEAIQSAQSLAVRYGHVEVDGEHLLLALLEQEGGLVSRLVQRLNVDPGLVIEAVRSQLQKLPSVSGPGVEPGKIYVTQRFNQILVKAESEAKRLKDDFVSVEHLLLVMTDEGNKTAVGRISALAIFGSQWRFCASVPPVRINSAAISERVPKLPTPI